MNTENLVSYIRLTKLIFLQDFLKLLPLHLSFFRGLFLVFFTVTNLVKLRSNILLV